MIHSYYVYIYNVVSTGLTFINLAAISYKIICLHILHFSFPLFKHKLQDASGFIIHRIIR